MATESKTLEIELPKKAFELIKVYAEEAALTPSEWAQHLVLDRLREEMKCQHAQTEEETK